MRIKKAVIALTVAEVQQVLRISMDDDEEGALHFVKDVLSKRVKEAIQDH